MTESENSHVEELNLSHESICSRKQIRYSPQYLKAGKKDKAGALVKTKEKDLFKIDFSA